MRQGQIVFRKKWGPALDRYHFPHTFDPTEVLLASDKRHTATRVLYVDQLLPRKRIGGGFARAYKILGLLAQLGCRVTVIGTEEMNAGAPPPEWDNWKELEQNSIELFRHQAKGADWGQACGVVKRLLQARPTSPS